MNIIKLIIETFLLLFTISNTNYSQSKGTGLLLGDKYFENNAKSAPLMRGDYKSLPKSVSLKAFSPTPGSQGAYGTCTGWSCAYAGRTILESMRNNWSKIETNKNVFSPSYVYNQIKMSKDCFGGASLIDALNILRNQGGLKMTDFGYNCNLIVTDKDKKKAKKFTIVEYREVADRFTKNKVIKVKKSLSEYKPVIIAIDCPNSFFYAKELWKPKKTDYKQWSVGHALCVVGYDDNKYGGAVEIMNSWGADWGKNGYTWIKYKDFQFFCVYGFELIDKTIYEKNQWDLSGSLKFVESNGNPMRTIIKNGIFKMDKTYTSGTLFELFVSNNEPAYVYAFGTDLSNKTYKIFPFHDKMSPYLPYKGNNIAIPDEGSYNMLDENTGVTYYCFFYSNKELDFNSILKRFEKKGGSFEDNLSFALGDSVITPTNIDYSDGEIINFKAKSKGKNILPVIIKIVHN